MKYQKPAVEIMRERTSCRSFSDKKMDKECLLKLEDAIEEINREMNIKARFLTLSSSGKSEELGTYGMISGANFYLVGVTDKDEKNALEFGYLFEKIVLLATDLGLGSCWLGGTFNRSELSDKVTLDSNEFIPIVSPIGIKKEKPRVFEKAVRAAVGANKRKPWNQLFFSGNAETPLLEKDALDYKIPLEMVRLAPSASNKQPWRIVKDDKGYHFFVARTKGYGSPAFDLQKNDIGIAMCHFELATRELGLRGEWDDKLEIKVANEWEYITTWSASTQN